MSEYVNDIYAYLYDLEIQYAIGKNHLDGQRDVFPKMRAVLMDWINEVHLQYHFVQETFHMAVSIIDRYLRVNIHQNLPHFDHTFPLAAANHIILSFRTPSGSKDDVTTKLAIGWRCRPIHFIKI